LAHSILSQIINSTELIIWENMECGKSLMIENSMFLNCLAAIEIAWLRCFW
jgi:hypothetical protein